MSREANTNNFAKSEKSEKSEEAAIANAYTYSLSTEHIAGIERQQAYDRAQQLAAIGTADEERVFGYSITKVMQVITGENRYDKYNCLGAAQCLYNAWKQNNEAYTPEELLDLYQYTQPLTWISDEAYNAVVDIFIRGKTFDIVEDATMFYNPDYGISEEHEAQRFIVEINGVYYYSEIYNNIY